MPRLRTLVPILILPVLLAGCVYSREISVIRRDVEKALDIQLDREIVVSVGPRTFHTLGWMARRVPEPWSRMAGDLVSTIDRVKVGVFKPESRPDAGALTLSAMPRFRDSDWQSAVRVADPDGSVWLMYRERDESIRDMLVIVVGDEEVIITRIEGHLNELMEQAMTDTPFLIEMSRAGKD